MSRLSAVAANQPARPWRADQNRMNPTATFEELEAQVREFIRAASAARGGREPAAGLDLEAGFDRLAVRLFEMQYQHVAAYRNWCAQRGAGPGSVAGWRDIPAVPARAFKEFELTSLPADQRTTEFHSSGTTGQRPSRHFHNAASLSLYEASLLPWFEAHVLAGLSGSGRRLPAMLLCLTPPPEQAPHSSLVHMFATVQRRWAFERTAFVGEARPDGGWDLDGERAFAMLEASQAEDRPLVILGTAFACVHLLDQMAARHLRVVLPKGSRAMETGGYKGRSREWSKAELHGGLGRRLGLRPDHIVCEYGMSELSSQAYDWTVPFKERQTNGCENRSPKAEASTATAPPTRRFRFPPWARARVVSPETGREVAEGERGLLRLYDLANVRSVMAIQTEDLALERGDGFELLGRAAEAEPRGCSLASLPD